MNLVDYERSSFSQNGEDGIIEKILTTIESEAGFLVDIGAGRGVQNSNSRNLILNKRFGGLLVEANTRSYTHLAKTYKDVDSVFTSNSFVRPDNIMFTFDVFNVPTDFELLCMDIDSNDYHVWDSINHYQPKVVVLEYNPMIEPPQLGVVEYNKRLYWDGSDYYGASLQSYYNLGKKKGYDLIYCDESGSNAFFVRHEFFQHFSIKDNSPSALYKPPQFGLSCGTKAPNGKGWAPEPRERRLRKDVKINKRWLRI